MLNPVVFTERVVRDFLRYQLTTYPFADADLHAQLRKLLNIAESRHSPLMQGPYVSLSRPFREGPTVAQLVTEGVLHPLLGNIAPFPRSTVTKNVPFGPSNKGTPRSSALGRARVRRRRSFIPSFHAASNCGINMRSPA